MVHAPAAEKQAVQEGWAQDRTLIGSNEFFMVGPASDPAKIAEAKSALDAYRRIARPRPSFFPGGTIPAPTRRNCKSGRRPTSSRRETGTSSPRIL